MSDLLSIGSSGIGAYQRALATVSNNIANVGTDGYARQDVSIGANQPTSVGTTYVGTGARFDAVRRSYDAFAESNLRASNSDLQAQEPLLAYVNRLVDLMGDANIGLTAPLNQFFRAARDLSTDAASSVQRTAFLRDAQGLAAGFRQLAGQFGLIDTETRQAVQTGVGQVNAITGQLAQLNRQLGKEISASRQPSELLDQRDLLLRQLSSLASVRTSFADNGTVRVSVGDVIDQGVLVDGTNARSIGLSVASDDSAARLRFVIDPYGTPQGLPNLAGGNLGGLLAFREQVLQPSRDDLDSLAQTVVAQANAAHRGGIDAQGRLGGDLFRLDPATPGAAGMQVALADASQIAAAGQFRVLGDALNPGGARATVRHAGTQPATGLRGALADGLAPQLAQASVQIGTAQPYASLGVLATGTTDARVVLRNPAPGQQLQVLTRDGRHLLGSPLTAAQRQQLVREANGMEAGATYSDASLGQPYMGMDLFLGARAGVRQVQQFDAATGRPTAPLTAPALLVAERPPAATGPIAAGSFVLDGVALPALAQAGPLAATDLAAWLNGASAQTGVTASVDAAGRLQLARPDGNTSDDIRLGLGAGAQPSDLAALGFDTAAWVNGAARDDLVVFATNTSGAGTTAQLAAQWAGGAGDAQQAWRSRVLQLQFTSTTSYRVVDRASGSVLAERAWDPALAGAAVTFRGLRVAFDGAPQAGDRWTIDGNADGIGNNEAMLALAGLETARVLPGQLTLTEGYLDRVNRVGDAAKQATISRDALKVVHDQALQSRDAVSGVSLDEEAAALVRYQQAYQANAKVMSVAGDLFNAILQVR